MIPLSKKIFKGSLKLIGPLLFIFFVIKVVDPRQAVGLLQKVRIDILLLSLLFIPVSNAVISFRWWIVSKQFGLGTSLNELFQIYYISWFLSILPLIGISPLARLVYLKEKGKTTSTSLLSITVDKIFDIIGLLIFGLFGLIYFPQKLIQDFHLWFFVVILLFIVLFFCLFRRKLWNTFLEFIKQYAGKKFRRFGESLETDMALFRSQFDFVFFIKVLAVSIIIGLLRAALLYTLALSLNIHVGFVFLIACRALIGIVNIIPISISGLGTRDAILLLAFPLVGVPQEAAVALGFLAFLWALCSKFSGVFFWLKHPLPFSSIMAMKEKLST
ncbi:lysylphosphatidylglycerol synthase transmembrane domain-containing protein [Thermodesulfobacteriota bacterium]